MSAKADWMTVKAEISALEAERVALLAPTDEKLRALEERLELIEDECGEVIGRCEGCMKPIFDGDRYFPCDDGPDFCEECAPTWQDMLAEPSSFLTYLPDGDTQPMTAEEAKAACDKHIAAGGALTDSMAR